MMESQHIVDQLDGFFSIMDRESKHILLNQTAAKWLGFGLPEKGAGSSYNDIRVPVAESSNFFRQIDAMVLDANKRIFFLGYYGYQDGYRVIQGYKWPFLDQTQQVIGIGCQFQDVTRFNLINKDRLIFSPDFIGHQNNKTTQFCYLFKESDVGDMLSERERECLFFSLQRKTAREIGSILSLSHRTVEDYMDHVRIKFNCQSRSELLEMAALKNFGNALPLKYLKRLWQKGRSKSEQ